MGQLSDLLCQSQQLIPFLGFRFNHRKIGIRTSPENSYVFSESGVGRRRRSECLSAHQSKLHDATALI